MRRAARHRPPPRRSPRAALELDRHNRYLLMNGHDAYNRVKTIGFRCLKDVDGGAPAPYHYRSATPL